MDPRLPELGRRVILPADTRPVASASDESAYRQWRIEHGVAEGDAEIPSGRQKLFIDPTEQKIKKRKRMWVGPMISGLLVHG